MSDAVGLSYIEHLTAVPEDCQSRGRPLMLAINHDDRLAIVFRPRCKRWSCPYCAEINARLWTARTIVGSQQLIENGAVLSFLTLTSHRKLDANASTAVFGQAWDALLKRARRAGGGEFLMVPERHQDGRLHAHAVETYSFGERWWKDNAAACGLGYMADEEPARTAGGAGGYVSKYLTKTIATVTWPRYWRRVRTSRGFPKLEIRTLPEGWRFDVPKRDQDLAEKSARLQAVGFMVGWSTSADAWLFINENAPE